MKQFEIPQWGTENLRIVDVERPRPGPGQILVKIKAVSLNFRDLLIVQGLYNPKISLPLVPLSDGAGEVVELGPGARKFRLGERVAPTHAPGWIGGRGEPDTAPRGGPHPGVLAEYVALDERDAVRMPDYLSDVEAAALPCAGVTAWNSLFGQSVTKPGDRILILGTGGVALFALQFAKLAGAEVAITSKDDAKLARARAMGADHLINYTKDPEWGRTAREIFDGMGADKVIELGGAQTLAQSLRAVRRGGEVILIGSVSGAEVERLPLPPVFMRNVALKGVAVGNREHFEDMVRAMGRHRVVPVIDKIFDGLESFPDALRYLAAGAHFGKVGLRIA